jgi:hypothetical protein
VGEALGVGEHDARWRGGAGRWRERRREGEVGALIGGGRGARRSRKRCSPMGERVGWRKQGRDVGQCEVGRRGVGMRGVRSHRVDREVRGRTGGAESDGWRGRGTRAQGRSVGRAGFGWSVGLLDLGDGYLIHHPM